MITVFVLLVTLVQTINAWNLAPLGLNATFRLKHVSTYYIRAFLCIEPPSNARTYPTLVESFWPENFFALVPRAFPRPLAHARKGRRNDCSLIQQSMMTQVDSLNRLWLLDKGTDVCGAKIIVYDLIRDNVEVFRIEIQHFRGNEIATMKIGPVPTCCQVEEKIFFVLKDKPYLWVHDLIKHTWDMVSVSSRPYDNIQHDLPIRPHDVAFGHGKRLFIAESSGKLYQSDAGFNGTELSAEYLGDLIGAPSGLIVDSSGTMYYLVQKFGAVIRCLPRKGLSAEGNEIISLSSLPINQIFFGVQGSVWLASETPIFAYDHCHRLVDSVSVAAVVA